MATESWNWWRSNFEMAIDKPKAKFVGYSAAGVLQAWLEDIAGADPDHCNIAIKRVKWILLFFNAYKN